MKPFNINHRIFFYLLAYRLNDSQCNPAWKENCAWNWEKVRKLAILTLKQVREYHGGGLPRTMLGPATPGLKRAFSTPRLDSSRQHRFSGHQCGITAVIRGEIHLWIKLNVAIQSHMMTPDPRSRIQKRFSRARVIRAARTDIPAAQLVYRSGNRSLFPCYRQVIHAGRK